MDEGRPSIFSPDLSDAVIHPDGPDADFRLRDERFVAADDVKAALDAGQKLVFLDARAHGDFQLGHITGATSLPFYLLEDYLDELPKDVWIINYCGCPHAISGRAFDAKRKQGSPKSLFWMKGIMWRQRGYPVTVPSQRELPTPP